MDRLAFSAVWTVDAQTAEVIDVRFHKSVIRSVAAMSYGAAQAIIDDAADTSDDSADEHYSIGRLSDTSDDNSSIRSSDLLPDSDLD